MRGRLTGCSRVGWCLVDVVLALVVVVVAFYLILLRPVIAQQRRQRRDIASLSEGDEVLTSGGFYARVIEIRTPDEGPTLIRLEVAPGVVLRATPHAIQEVRAGARPAGVPDLSHPGDSDTSDVSTADSAGGSE